ncbi:DUF285 domain-containing protein (plasmid) [Rhodobacteraceae bacterium M382]|nr:DUF285 domain-containing protein [Rhodobacteraceae bacterium M382]
MTSLHGTFDAAAAFDQDISGWVTSNVRSMIHIFEGATSFDQSLGVWDLSSLSSQGLSLSVTAMSMDNFDATLDGWAQLDPGETRVPRNISLGAEDLIYSNVTAFDSLEIDFSWAITGARYWLEDSAENDRLDGSGGAYRIVTDGLAWGPPYYRQRLFRYIARVRREGHD